MKKLAIDSYYYSETDCYTVGFVFSHWNSKRPDYILESTVTEFSPYIPGEFYKRELPGILSIVQKVNLREFDTIILDGFTNLIDNSGDFIPGLGERLESEITIHNNLSIIGVAKTLFGKSDLYSYPLYRGSAKNPLWISITSGSSIDLNTAYNRINSMYGDNKLPDILKQLDKYTKRFI